MSASFTVKERSGVVVISPCDDRIDLSTAAELKRTFRNLLALGATRFQLDVSRVETIDRSGLSAVLAALRLVPGQGGLSIVGAQGDVSAMFKRTDLDRVFDMRSASLA